MRRVNLTNGLVTTLAGNAALSGGPPNNVGHADGVGTAASFYFPVGIAIDSTDTFAVVVRCLVYFLRYARRDAESLRFLETSPTSLLQADQYNNLLRRINLVSGLVTTIAGNAALSGGPPNNVGHADGVGTASSFNRPTGVAFFGAGMLVVVVRSMLELERERERDGAFAMTRVVHRKLGGSEECIRN